MYYVKGWKEYSEFVWNKLYFWYCVVFLIYWIYNMFENCYGVCIMGEVCVWESKKYN